ncbi:hypothetical protein JCM10213_006224 [Rhodosporidiobolus nylandii]
MRRASLSSLRSSALTPNDVSCCLPILLNHHNTAHRAPNTPPRPRASPAASSSDSTPAMPLRRLPLNARSSLVVLKRPCTFLLAFAFSLAAFVSSAFFTLTRLQPPSCPCHADSEVEPRTRPRPAPPSPPKAHDALPPEPAPTAFDSFFAAFRPKPATHTRPPPARRLSTRAVGGFAYHELDELVEAREEEELAEREDAVARLVKSRTPSLEGVAPALTPDGGSEVDTDLASEVDTLEDEQGHVSPAAREGRHKSLAVLTGLRFRRTPSTSRKAAASSPTAEEPPVSPADSTHSAPSSSKCAIKALRQRQRSATVSGSSKPSLPSIRTTPAPRRQFSEPGPSSPSTTDYFTRSTSSAASSLSSMASSSLLHDASPTSSVTSIASHPPASSAAPPLHGRKRSVSSLLLRTPFRSLSPLSRSPLTSPEPSPPPSPTINAGFAAVAGAVKPSRRRGRSPGPLAQAPPLSRRVSDGAGADLTGASGLVLSDLLQR